MQKPNPHKGLRHVALFVKNFNECQAFYTELLGLTVDWHPDADNIYLTSGSDNVALHRAPAEFVPAKFQHLDHIGFFLNERNDVDDWFQYLSAQGVKIKAPPKDHRDGSRSFYCADPDNNTIQLIFMP